VGLTPEEIEVQDFTRSRRGFDPDEVRSYLNQIGNLVRHLQNEIGQSNQRAVNAENQLASGAPAPVEADQFGALER